MVIPVRLIFGLIYGLFTGNWAVFKSSLIFWVTLFGVIACIGLPIAAIVQVAPLFPQVRAVPSVSTNTSSAPDTSAPILANSPTPTSLNGAASSQADGLPTAIPTKPLLTQAPPAIKKQPTATRAPAPTRVTSQQIVVCTRTGFIYDAPASDAKIIDYVDQYKTITTYGKRGDYYYLGDDDKGQSYFIKQADTCDPSKVSIPPPIPNLCVGYKLPSTPNIIRYNSSMQPIRGVTRPNGIKVYFDIADAEYWDKNQTGGSQYFACPAAAQAAGFVAAHPK